MADSLLIGVWWDEHTSAPFRPRAAAVSAV
jgi:hypothetical protein